MPVDLAELLRPDRTAVLTMELQRGVAGDLSALPQLADAVRDAGVLDATARLLAAARRSGASVVHCVVERRADGKGTVANAPLLSAMGKRPGHMAAGSDAAQLVPELGPDPGDVVSARAHGLSPFAGTSLDITLRNLGVRTVVATGVSVNLGILGLAIEAVNLGYWVVVPTDAVTGLPADYAEQVLANTVSLVATLTTTDQIIDAWQAG